MRKIFLFLFFACFMQAQTALPWCRLGTNPVDPTRQPDWAAECVVKSPPTPVTMMTGSGRQVRCLLPPLTPVVVDRQSGVAKWVLQCGNPILQPANWVPSGTRICGPETAQPAAAPAPAATPAAPAVTPTPPAEVKVAGEIRHVHEGTVRLVHEHESAPSPEPAPAPQPRKGWWSRNWRWFVPVAIGAGAGTAVALTRGGKNTVYYQPLPPPLYRP